MAAAAKRNRSFSSRRRVMASTAPSLRDTHALQAKLDELLHAHNQANNALTKIDDQEPEDIVRHRRLNLISRASTPL